MKSVMMFFRLVYVAVIMQALSVSLCANVHRKDTVLFFSRNEFGEKIVKGADGEQYTRICCRGMAVARDVGLPELPHKHVTLAIPVDAMDVSLDITMDRPIPSKVSSQIYPVQGARITSASWREPRFAPCDSLSYADSAGFPNKVACITDISGCSDMEKRVGLDVWPIKYFPIENKCEFYGVIRLSIKYKLPSAAKLIARQSDACLTTLPLYEYCIITSRNLEKSFARLKGWIRQKGMNAGVVCVEDIVNAPNIKGDTVSNLNDDAGKIRQYLQYGYKYGGTRYVLFGGNDSVVPVRYGTAQRNTWDYFAEIDGFRIPSDFYYAELNSNWNVDGDKYIGEPHSLMDYKAELSVGRLLCTSSQEVDNYTEKLFVYEMNPGMGDYSYLRKAFLSEADGMQEKNEAHIVADEISDVFPDTTIISELPDYSDWNPTFPSGNDMIAELSNHYGYVTWINHGEPPFIVTKMSSFEAERKNAIVATSKFKSMEIYEEQRNSIEYLNNRNYPMVAYGIACHVAAFDNHKKDVYGDYLNFARSFTTCGEYGGPAFIGNTRVGYEDSTYYVQLYFNKFMRKCPIGESLNMAKLYNPDKTDLHHHSLLVNVVGCPDLNIWTSSPLKQKVMEKYEQNSVSLIPTVFSDSTYVCICTLGKDRKAYTIPADFRNGAMLIPGVANCLVTLKGRNCLPCIMPLYLQNTIVSGCNYIQTSDVKVGSDIRKGSQGDVVFESGSCTVMEKTGKVMLTKNVVVEKGAQLVIKPSTIRK